MKHIIIKYVFYYHMYFELILAKNALIKLYLKYNVGNSFSKFFFLINLHVTQSYLPLHFYPYTIFMIKFPESLRSCDHRQSPEETGVFSSLP